MSSQKLHFHATLSHFSISTRKYWIYHLYTYISIATRPSTCEGLVLLVVHLGSVCGQLSQLRGVRVTTRRKGKVERGDCDDCMILAHVLLNDLNTTELASFPDHAPVTHCMHSHDIAQF